MKIIIEIHHLPSNTDYPSDSQVMNQSELDLLLETLSHVDKLNYFKMPVYGSLTIFNKYILKDCVITITKEKA